eukprot:1155740-Pelagomonas_calceolata.AAC.2
MGRVAQHVLPTKAAQLKQTRPDEWLAFRVGQFHMPIPYAQLALSPTAEVDNMFTDKAYASAPSILAEPALTESMGMSAVQIFDVLLSQLEPADGEMLVLSNYDVCGMKSGADFLASAAMVLPVQTTIYALPFLYFSFFALLARMSPLLVVVSDNSDHS